LGKFLERKTKMMEPKTKDRVKSALGKVYKGFESLGRIRIKDATDEEMEGLCKIVEDKWSEEKEKLNASRKTRKTEKVNLEFDF